MPWHDSQSILAKRVLAIAYVTGVRVAWRQFGG